MLKKISILLFVLSFLQTKKSLAQDPMFTQFYANPLYLNPAFAGNSKCPRANLNYRNQWPGLGPTYVTYSASYDQHFDPISGGLGLLVTNDKTYYPYAVTNISGIYSFLIPASRNFSIRTGFQGTYFQRRVDADKLTYGDMIDPQRGFIHHTQETTPANVSGIDFSAGAIGYGKRYFIGLAMHHITKPNESVKKLESDLPRRITGHAGFIIPLGGKEGQYSLSPNILFRQQAKFQELNLGMYANIDKLVTGVWYRHKDAVMVLLGFQFSVFKIGYSYDFTISQMKWSNTKGAHEVSLGMQFYCKTKKKKVREIACPSF